MRFDFALADIRARSALSMLALGLFLILPSVANATEKTDVLVGIKSLSMLNRELPSTLVIGVVYDPANMESQASADVIKSVLESGVKTSEGKNVSPLLIPVSDVDKLGQVTASFVTPGLKSHFDAIAQAAGAHNVLTMSTDLDCVRSNKCVLGIASKNVVEIYYSRAASETAKIDFDSAFIMLIKKV